MFRRRRGHRLSFRSPGEFVEVGPKLVGSPNDFACFIFDVYDDSLGCYEQGNGFVDVACYTKLVTVGCWLGVVQGGA